MKRFRLLKLQFVLVLGLIGTASLAEDDQFDFMPDGGRTILAKLLAELDPDTMRDVLDRAGSVQEWTGWAQETDPALSDDEATTFANYAAINLPLHSDQLAAASEAAAANLLPADGKDLAVAHCQSCHALFSGYLMHDRDRAGWESTFKSPFHTEIPMTEAERATFASYSAINMPLGFDDVPPELRF